MKGIFKRVMVWFGTILSVLRNEIEEWIEPAIKVVQAIKKAVDDPAFDFITALTPTKFDELLLERIREGLFHALTVLKITFVAKPKENERFEDYIQRVIEQLREVSPELREGIYKGIARLVAQHLSDNKLKSSEANLLIEMVYNKNYK